MKKGNLFSTIAFIFSFMLLIVSGAIYVYSAQQQSVSSSLSVTFSGQNVNFEAQGWYHVHGGSRTAMVNSQGGNTVSFSATETSVEKTLKISNTEAENKAVLTSEHPYVLFTYKFVNTASSGAFAIGVSLNITPTPTNLKTITYASSTTLYTEANLDTFKATVTGTSTFSSDTIAAGGTSGATSGNSVKYYYILLEVDDLTLSVNFTPTFSWDVGCAIPPSPAEWFNVDVNGVCSGLTSAWESSSDPDKNDLVLPSTITSIGDNAFRNCSTSLTSISIPNSVTSIGHNAFNSCTGLTSISIPNSVTSIGNYAFGGCTSLTSISIPNGVTSIGEGAFFGCNDQAFTIDNDAKYLGNSDNQYLVLVEATSRNITSCEISEYCKVIADSALARTALTSISIPNGVTSIGENAFRRCTSLTSITIPSSVTSIGERAFSECSTSVTSITVDANNTAYKSVDNCLLNKVGTTLILGCKNSIIPSSVTSIGERAFYSCTGLTSISIPNSVTSIGYYAFNGCTGLTSISIPNGVTSMGEYAFNGCTGLTSISITNGVTSIGRYAFSRCTGLTSISIPNSITSIGYNAFEGCTNLTSVTFEDTSGWQMSSDESFSNPSDIDVTDASTNATNLKRWSGELCWCYKYLRKVSV